MIRTLTLCALTLFCTVAIAQEGENILYDFGTSWCGPCQRVAPIVAKLHREGLPIRKVDAEKERSLAAKYGINSYPTFVLVVNGREVQRRSGYMSETEIRRWVAKIPQSTSGSDPVQSGGILLGEAADLPRPSPPPSTEVKTAEAADSSSSPLKRLLGLGKKKPEEQLVRGNDSLIAEAAAKSNGPLAADPMQASVRIRVIIDGKINLGSGTVISSRPGKTVILTCGHIFRHLDNKSKIEVDFINSGQPVEHVAKVQKYDIESDLGVIVVATENAVPVAPIASRVAAPAIGDSVAGIGCSGGELPTERDIEVTAIDRYIGPHNVECTGLPVQGRSGGGLFNNLGEIVGVCIAADRDRRRGLYSGLFAIHGILDECGMTSLYQPEQKIQIAGTDLSYGETDAPKPMPQEVIENQTAPTASAVATTTPIQRDPVDFRARGSEVVVIVRDPKNPNAPNRVVIIHDASEKFMAYLNGELDERPAISPRTTVHHTLAPTARSLRSASNHPQSLASNDLRRAEQAGQVVRTSLSKPVGPQRYVRSSR